MYSAGNVTVYVANMDASVHFYTEVLGLKLVYRFGDNWAHRFVEPENGMVEQRFRFAVECS